MQMFHISLHKNNTSHIKYDFSQSLTIQHIKFKALQHVSDHMQSKMYLVYVNKIFG